MKTHDPTRAALDGFLERFRAAAREGRGRLLEVGADYDRAEARRRSGRIDTVTRLAGASVRVGVMFPVPLESLGNHGQLAFTHPVQPQRPGVWLTGAGIDPQDPVDVVRDCLQDDPDLLADLVLPEVALHGIVRDPAWAELRKAYHVTCTVRAGRDGLSCDVVIELEAY